MVSIAPIAHWVKKVGGDHVSVSVFIPQGKSKESFDPTPRHLAGVQNARVFFALGVGFEKPWLHKVRAAFPDTKIIGLSRAVHLLPMTEEHHHGEGAEDADEGDHETTDPHFWVSPRCAREAVREIARALGELSPAEKKVFARNALAYDRSLQKLDGDMGRALKPFAGKTFLVVHPELAYLAQDYGLKQMAVEAGGREPSARQMKELLDRARATGVRQVLAQREVPLHAARPVAQALGGRVVRFSVLSEDYEQDLHNLVVLLRQGWEGPP